MKQTVEEAANALYPDNSFAYKGFIVGAEWQAKQSPWIRLEDRLPEEHQRVLLYFLYYYKYGDREAESREYTDTFTYEDGVWITDSGVAYLGKEAAINDIKAICWMPIPCFRPNPRSQQNVLQRIKEQ